MKHQHNLCILQLDLAIITSVGTALCSYQLKNRNMNILELGNFIYHDIYSNCNTINGHVINANKHLHYDYEKQTEIKIIMQAKIGIREGIV